MASAKDKIQPLADRVVVQALEESETTRGGLYIPDTAQKEKPMQGTIVAVGPGKMSDENERIKPDVEVGQTVLYGKYSGTEVSVDDEDFLILRESDILAIIS